MSAPLERERQTYEEKKTELLAGSSGKYVVIHGDQVIGVWDTQDDALRAGYERFGLEPFLVKQVTEVEPVHYFTRDIPLMPSLTIAIPQDGPLVQMTIGVTSARATALRSAGLPIPPSVFGRGLVDTGASA